MDIEQQVIDVLNELGYSKIGDEEVGMDEYTIYCTKGFPLTAIDVFKVVQKVIEQNKDEILRELLVPGKIDVIPTNMRQPTERQAFIDDVIKGYRAELQEAGTWDEHAKAALNWAESLWNERQSRIEE